jgi:hypothetical protein
MTPNFQIEDVESQYFQHGMGDKQPFCAPICREIDNPGPDACRGGMNLYTIQRFADRAAVEQARTNSRCPLPESLQSYDLAQQP